VAHESSVGRFLVRFHPGRILGGFSAGDAPSVFRLEGVVRIEKDIHPDDNFQRDQGVNWGAIAIYWGYLLALALIVRCCWR
jgi:hypothetical protein